MNQGEFSDCEARFQPMIVRNINDKEVLDTTYLAHGGAIAQMILDRRILQEIGFLAIARLLTRQ